MNCNELRVDEDFDLHRIRFRIIKELPSGSFGDPYIIENNGFCCVMKSNIFEEDQYFMKSSNYKALLNESKIGLRLGLHPNVVTFLTFERKKSNCIYTAMEYVKDGDLTNIFEEKGISNFELLLDLSIDISSGINHLHSHNIIHRDLSPTNIFLESTSSENKGKRLIAKVADFSISFYDNKRANDPDKCNDENEFDEIDKEYVGNPCFVSPEQLNQLPSGKEKDTDLFSFGMLLLRMLTGDNIIDQHKLNTTADLHVSEKELKEKISTSVITSRENIERKPLELLIDLITKCLHFQPSLRWKIEKDEKTFEYFDTVKKELFNIRQMVSTRDRYVEYEIKGSPYLFQLRGGGFLNLGCYENAKSNLFKSLQSDSTNVNTLCNLGLAHYYENQFDEALSYLDRANGIDKDDPFIYAYVGNVFSRRGLNPEYAIRYYDKALQLDPNNFDANYNKGYLLIYHCLGIAGAKNCLERAYNHDKANPLLNYYIGFCYLKEDNLAEYTRFFDQSIISSGKSQEFYKKICRTLIDNNKCDLALSYCKEAIKTELHKDNEEIKDLEIEINDKLKG